MRAPCAAAQARGGRRRGAGSRRAGRGACVKPSASMRTTASKSSRAQRGVRPGAAHQCEQRVLVPFAAGDLGDDLLRQHVERRLRDAQRVELAAAHAVEQRRALDQVVARLREQPALGHAADVRGRSGRRAAGRRRSSAASRAGRPGRRRRCRCRARATRSRPAPSARRASAAARRRAAVPCARLPWCAATRSLPSRSPRWRAARSAMRRVLTNTSVVRCCAHQLGDALVDLLPLVVRHHRLQRRRRQFEREVALLGVADVDDRAVGRAVGRDRARRRPGSARPRRSASASPTGRSASARAAAQRLQPLERQRQVAAALARGDGVDLVDDHRAHRRQHRAAATRSRAARTATRAWSPGCAAACLRSCARSACGVSPVRTAVRIVDVGQAHARAARRGCRPAAPRG